MKKIFLCLYLFTQNPLLANMGPQGFSAYLNKYFVETGTFGGDGIAKALAAGFQYVRSIEFDKAIFTGACRRFTNYPNVKIVQGSSANQLWNLIKDIEAPITFWLDAHIYPPLSEGKNCPLIEELEQIRQHPIKNHTILIDDMHCAGTAAFDFLTKEDLIAKILEINPDYQISYVPGGDEGEYPQNVMVAIVPK